MAGGDHSLAIAKRDAPDGRRRPEEAVLLEVAAAVHEWLEAM